jgi:hypothetical protein
MKTKNYEENRINSERQAKPKFGEKEPEIHTLKSIGRSRQAKAGIMTPEIASEYAVRLDILRKWKKPNFKSISSLEERKDAFYQFCIKTGTSITNEAM